MDYKAFVESMDLQEFMNLDTAIREVWSAKTGQDIKEYELDEDEKEDLDVVAGILAKYDIEAFKKCEMDELSKYDYEYSSEANENLCYLYTGADEIEGMILGTVLPDTKSDAVLRYLFKKLY